MPAFPSRKLGKDCGSAELDHRRSTSEFGRLRARLMICKVGS